MIFSHRIHHIPPSYFIIIESYPIIILPSTNFLQSARFCGNSEPPFLKNFTCPKIAVCLVCASSILRLVYSSITANVASEFRPIKRCVRRDDRQVRTWGGRDLTRCCKEDCQGFWCNTGLSRWGDQRDGL